MKMDEKKIKAIERQLNSIADVYYSTYNNEVKERNRGYCQGIDYVLSMLGYAIEWNDGKATVVDCN